MCAHRASAFAAGLVAQGLGASRPRTANTCSPCAFCLECVGLDGPRLPGRSRSALAVGADRPPSIGLVVRPSGTSFAGCCLLVVVLQNYTIVAPVGALGGAKEGRRPVLVIVVVLIPAFAFVVVFTSATPSLSIFAPMPGEAAEGDDARRRGGPRVLPPGPGHAPKLARALRGDLPRRGVPRPRVRPGCARARARARARQRGFVDICMRALADARARSRSLVHRCGCRCV